jgi:hypothetical protein
LSLAYLRNDFTDNVKEALADSEVEKTVSDTLSSYTGPDAISQMSSFGIGVGLAFLGQYLATKKRGSPTARCIARILGTDVDAINRDYILQKLKDKDYAVRENILNVIQTSSIEEFARSVDLSTAEAWGVYMQIKDLIVDSEVLGRISQLNETVRIAITAGLQELRRNSDSMVREAEKTPILNYADLVYTKIHRPTGGEDYDTLTYYLKIVKSSGLGVAEGCHAFIDLPQTNLKHLSASWSDGTTRKISIGYEENLHLFTIESSMDSRKILWHS